MRIALLALTFAIATPLAAQMPKEVPGKPDTSRVVAGSYALEPKHTQVRFTVMHFGFTPFTGMFGGASGTLEIDPAHPAATRVSVSVPVGTALVTVQKLTDELRSPMFFDPAQYPAMTFVSDKVTFHGKHATIAGKLTMHGVTRPLTLEANFVGAGTFMGKRTIGFTATGTLNRSDYGIKAVLPLVSDAVQIDIAAAFEQPA